MTTVNRIYRAQGVGFHVKEKRLRLMLICVCVVFPALPVYVAEKPLLYNRIVTIYI